MIWCLPVVICTVSVRVPEDVFSLSTRLPSKYSAHPVSGLGPCATALIAAGEEEPRGFSATERVVAVVPVAPDAGIVTATEELPALPALLVAVAVIWCRPAVRGMDCEIWGWELACCHTSAESTANCHCLMG